MKCKLAGRAVLRNYRQKPENVAGHDENIKDQNNKLPQNTSSQKIKNTNNSRFCDVCKTWISKSNTTHYFTKTHWNIVEEKQKDYPFPLPSNSDIKPKKINWAWIYKC